MTDALAYLINIIEDEFRGRMGIRIRPVFSSTTLRSPDLEQDYDAESGSLHRRSGVAVQAGRREYFFPESWVQLDSRKELERQVQEIWNHLEESGL
jgi:hypothetical protein